MPFAKKIVAQCDGCAKEFESGIGNYKHARTIRNIKKDLEAEINDSKEWVAQEDKDGYIRILCPGCREDEPCDKCNR